MLEETLDKTFL